MKTEENFDVILIGGSYAGLSGAMALGRSLRKVLVIDSGCTRQTPHYHNRGFFRRYCYQILEPVFNKLPNDTVIFLVYDYYGKPYFAIIRSCSIFQR